jgi:hypothetical protein
MRPTLTARYTLTGYAYHSAEADFAFSVCHLPNGLRCSARVPLHGACLVQSHLGPGGQSATRVRPSRSLPDSGGRCQVVSRGQSASATPETAGRFGAPAYRLRRSKPGGAQRATPDLMCHVLLLRAVLGQPLSPPVMRPGPPGQLPGRLNAPRAVSDASCLRAGHSGVQLRGWLIFRAVHGPLQPIPTGVSDPKLPNPGEPFPFRIRPGLVCLAGCPPVGLRRVRFLITQAS